MAKLIGPKLKAHVLLSCKACQAFSHAWPPPSHVTSGWPKQQLPFARLPCVDPTTRGLPGRLAYNEDLPTCLARPGPPMQIVVHSGLRYQLHLRRPSSRLSLRRPVGTINPSWPCPFTDGLRLPPTLPAWFFCIGPWLKPRCATSNLFYVQSLHQPTVSPST